MRLSKWIPRDMTYLNRADVRGAHLSTKVCNHELIAMKLALSSGEHLVWGYSLPKANNDDASDVFHLIIYINNLLVRVICGCNLHIALNVTQYLHMASLTEQPAIFPNKHPTKTNRQLGKDKNKYHVHITHFQNAWYILSPCHFTYLGTQIILSPYLKQFLLSARCLWN